MNKHTYAVTADGRKLMKTNLRADFLMRGTSA